MRAYKIAVAGAGYVGMAMAVLLSQHHQVTVVDIVPEKISMINRRESPVRDDVMQQVLSHTPLQLSATLDAQAAYADADFVVIAVPTNYDDVTQRFQTAAVEEVIGQVTQCNPDAAVVIKSTVPVGYTASVREKFHNRNILFSPEFLRESHAMEDSLYPSRIIVGTDMQDTRLTASARAFAALLQEGAEKPNVDTLLMGFSEAEAVKLFANTYLALRVAYFNELDTYAESKGLNTRQILDGVCLDPRIGSHYNNRLLPAEGHQAAAGELRRCAAEHDFCHCREQQDAQGLYCRPCDGADDGKSSRYWRLPPDDEARQRQLPPKQHTGRDAAPEGERRIHRDLRADTAGW